jgi:predicted transcriptional regulator
MPKSQAVEEAIRQLIHNGMIAEAARKATDPEVRFMTTEKGNVYVHALLALPFPVQKWVIPTEDK